MKKISIGVFLVFVSSLALAQKNVEQQTMLWTRYYNILELNKKWSIHTELDNRSFTKNMVHNSVVGILQGKYKLQENIELGSGLAYFSVAHQGPDDNQTFVKPEYRLLQNIA